MNTKKKVGIGAGAVALFTAALLTFFGISGDKTVELTYHIEANDQTTSLFVDVPDKIEADIMELYCNDGQVTKTLLPKNELKSIPLVFTDLSNLTIRLYKYDEVIGLCKFDADDKLICALK